MARFRRTASLAVLFAALLAATSAVAPTGGGDTVVEKLSDWAAARSGLSESRQSARDARRAGRAAKRLAKTMDLHAAAESRA